MRATWDHGLIPEGVDPFWEFFLTSKLKPRLRFLAYLHLKLGRWSRVAAHLNTTPRTLFRWVKEDQKA